MNAGVETEPEILVIGGNPGGCAAAIAAARSGRQVLLLEPTRTLGGINANGVFAFDAATPQALSGIAEEVGERIREHYRRIGMHDPLFHRRSDQVWESHVAALVWGELAAETEGLSVILGAVPTRVVADGRKIREVHWVPAIDGFGNVSPSADVHIVKAALVIDASYEADVTAWSGVPFRIGREARTWYEPHAGKVFTSNMTASPDGHLANSVLPGSTGEADEAIMAFACRLHCRIFNDSSPDAAHRIKAPPPGYDPSNYSFDPVGFNADGSPIFFNTIFVLVNGKVLLNRMVRGNNLAGPGRAYVLAHPRDRKALRERYINHALGFLYFVQNDGGLPTLGLAPDEFIDNGNIPYQIYVREGRRIEGRETLTEADITPYIAGDGIRPPSKKNAVAMGDWTFESHGCSDHIEPGHSHPEGWVFNRVTRAPFQVPYGSLLPAGIDNLLVCGAVSSTHIAFCALRCEAVRIQHGTAAGIAASMALELGRVPADVPVPALQAQIISRGGKLTYFADVGSEHPNFASIQWAALQGLTPPDKLWRFFPDHPVDWSEFVKSIVVALHIPISVSGAHFEGIDPRHDSFRYVEALYDLGTRADVDIFNAAQLQDEDPVTAILRHTTGPRLIPFVPDAAVTESAAQEFLQRVTRAGCAKTLRLAASLRPGYLLTRGAMCSMLQQLAVELDQVPDNQARIAAVH